MPTTDRSRHAGLLLALLAFAQLIIAVDYNIVFVALPEIGSGLGFSSQTLQWVVSAYAVAFGGFLLLGGRAADLFGRRRMFVFGLALYGVSSLVGGLATSPEVLIAARAVQGLGGAFLFPATLSLVTTSFAEGPERNRALAVWGGAGGGGLVLGSLLGGVLTQAFGWEAVFFVNVPLAAIALGLAYTLIRPDGAREPGRTFDLPGALTATVGATLFVFTLVEGPESGWTSPLILTSAAASVVILAAFLAIEARSSDPLMPLRVFRNRNLSTGTAITALFAATFSALAYFITLYFQNVHGYSPLRSGMAFLAPTAAVFLTSTFSGHVINLIGVRGTLVTGLSLGAVGTVLLGLGMSADGSYAAVLPGLIVLNLGQGFAFVTMFTAAATGVASGDQGIASGIASTGQQVGGAVGLALLVAVANSGTAGRTDEALRLATADGLQTVVYIAAAGLAATVLVALNLKKPAPKVVTVHEPAVLVAAQ